MFPLPKWSVASLLALSAWTLGALPAGAQEFPFTGAITADDANVRAGAGDNYYVVLQLKSGALVRVHDNLYGWYEISPPAGAFSYLAKEYVRMEPDGKKGTVAGQRVRVRAPSPAGPDASYRTQLVLNDGDSVEVVGEDGDFYKVAPPAEARLYVHKDFVAPATPEQIAAAQKIAPPVEPPAPAAPKPVSPSPAPVAAAPVVSPAAAPVAPAAPAAEPMPPVPQPSPVAQPAAKPAATAPSPAAPSATSPGPAPEASPKPVEKKPAAPPKLDPVAEMEKRFAAAMKQPVGDRPLDDLKSGYEKLAGSDLSAPHKSLVSARLQMVDVQLQIRASLDQISATKKGIEQSRKKQQAALRAAKNYTAVGRLESSTLYNGQQLPLLYRLVDPVTGSTAAYVGPAGAPDQLVALLGQYVGVTGRKDYDSALKLSVISVTEVDVLKAEPAPK